ncbi:putative lipoprotein [Spiroplasma phoeniceum P40]|uniref:Lipoprotein n=2 Tax=Spiroplasma phoeniceum TaxID=47835 RepID=A0A345DMR9_9MOLU|nr:putative lipoprotein [Spiroplasma phoeniceum P40]
MLFYQQFQKFKKEGRIIKIKKWLIFLWVITLLGTSTTSVVAFNNIPQYNENELQQLKKENQIYTNCKEIKENLEWIAPQEKPFNTVDNKYYFVVWRSEKNKKWRIAKFKNSIKVNDSIIIDLQDNNRLRLGKFGYLMINSGGFFWGEVPRWDIEKIKYVYRWNGGEENLSDLVVDNDGNLKVKDK